MVVADRRPLLFATATLGLSGCAMIGAPGSTTDTGALAKCPSVKSASAWINRQPSTDKVGARLVVSVRLNELEKWTAIRGEGSDPEDLTLHLASGGEGYDGIVGYREPIKSYQRKRVSIMCNGQMIGEVAEIHSVY